MRVLSQGIEGALAVGLFISSFNRLTATRKVLQRYLNRYENESNTTSYFSTGLEY